ANDGCAAAGDGAGDETGDLRFGRGPCRVARPWKTGCGAALSNVALQSDSANDNRHRPGDGGTAGVPLSGKAREPVESGGSGPGGIGRSEDGACPVP